MTIIKCVCMRERKGRRKERKQERKRKEEKEESPGNLCSPSLCLFTFLTQITWVQIMFPPLGASSCDSLGKQLSLSMLQFLVHKIGVIMAPVLYECVKMKLTEFCKMLRAEAGTE